MPKEKIFLSDETKKLMIKDQGMMNNYTLDAFDYAFSKLDEIQDSNNEKLEKIINKIPTCEKELIKTNQATENKSIWRHIKTQWGVLIAVFITLITVYIIK
jgi:hypothetical protein